MLFEMNMNFSKMQSMGSADSPTTEPNEDTTAAHVKHRREGSEFVSRPDTDLESRTSKL